MDTSDLDQGAWLDSTPAIKYILSHQGTTKPIPAEAKEAASEAPTAGPNGRPGQNDVASPERNGKAPKAAPTPSDLDWASEAIQHLGAAYRDDYDQWLKVGLALAGLGSDGLAIWDDWSRQSPKYEEGCCVAKWSSFTPNHGLTLGSLYHWAKAEGWPGPSKIPARGSDSNGEKTTIFTGTDVQMVGGAAAAGSGDMDNIILGTSLACAAGVAAAFRADLRALRARERAMRQGAEFSWGPNGHELRIVLPGLRSAEVTAVESGRIEAALLVELPVLFLLIRFRGQTDRVALSLVYSCCWWGNPEERTDPPASEVVRFVLVEGQSGIVRAIRTSSFSLEFTRSLHGAIDEQARLGYDPAHEVAVEAMLRQYLTDQLWHCCQVRCSA